MTSRERVLAALNHKQPDRVPLDLSAHRSSGIAAIAYPRLRKQLGLPPTTVRVYDPIQQLAIVDDDVLDMFGVDAIELGRGFSLKDSDWVDWTLPDGSPCQMPVWAEPVRGDGEWILRSAKGTNLARMPDNVPFFDQTYWIFLEEDDLDHLPEAFAESMWSGIASPPGPSESDPATLAAGAKRLRESTDRAIVGLFGGNLLECGEFVYRMDNFMMLLAGEPQRAHAFLDKLVEMHLGNLERYLKTLGPYIDIIAFGDDLGGQKGPLLSPKMYREFFKPRHKILWERAKELADVKVMLHCCGGVRPLMADLIDAGLEAINPVQISSKGMDAAGLKAEFGADMTFWGGGCDTHRVLPHGTPDEVREHVREQIDAFSPGGGFVFQQVHNIQADVPPANIVAMLETVRDYG